MCQTGLMKIIGAGFARTGTLSLKTALDRLGYGPCYHMFELIAHQERLPQWEAAANGDPVDWDEVFNGYQSTVDWPGCYFWRQLCCVYPQAKVILTIREPDSWFDSHAALFRAMRARSAADWKAASLFELGGLIKKILIHGTFADRLNDRDFCVDLYNRHNEEVRRALPAERLLVFDVREGWAPLCAFLGVDVPDEPFPHLNDRGTVAENVRDVLVGAPAR
jgi:hypothetical protein